MQSKHAIQRSQQRGIPQLIKHWLLDYGEESFDGHGAVIRYFTPKSIRRMEQDFGRDPLRRLSEYMRCYLVESAHDGAVITVGKRFNSTHVWRH
jgi:hypothetical protein